MSLPALSSMPFQVELFAASALCFFLIAWLVIFILIAVWVYRDAESRGMGGVLWLLVVILLGLIGLIIYLIVRAGHPVVGRPPTYGAYPPQYPPAYPPQAPPTAPPPQAAGATVTCRNCGSPVAAGVAFCPRCGAKL